MSLVDRAEQTNMQKIQSAFLRLNQSDLIKGVTLAFIVAGLGAIQQAFETKGVHIASFDWANIFDVAWKSGLGYIGKNLISDEQGKVMGIVG